MTVPKAVRQGLGVGYGGRTSFRVTERSVTVHALPEDKASDPALVPFLALLKADMARRPAGAALPFAPALATRLETLAKELGEVDPDARIKGEVALSRHGWTLHAHPMFLDQIERLLEAVERAKRSSPEGMARQGGHAAADYGHVDHGYAATVYKAQGLTVDRAHVLASRFMHRHGADVGLTRHRAGVSLHYGRDEFADSAALALVLGRERSKDTTLDYGDRSGVEDLVAGYAARRELAPERETALRQEAVWAASEQKAAEQAQAIDAGKAGFRARYEARKAEQAAAKERKAQVRSLVRAWDLALDAYGKALPGLEVDATLGSTRERLEQLGRAMKQQPGVVQVLRERGAEFGMGDQPQLAWEVASTQPERVVGHVATG